MTSLERFQESRYAPLLLFLFAVSVTPVLVLVAPMPDQTGGDFSLYQRIAHNILSEGDFGGEPQKTYGSASISPGWSFFLAGHELIFGKSEFALFVASMVFGGLLVVGVYIFAQEFFDNRTAITAGIITAIWPIFLIQILKYTSSLLFYCVITLWGLYFFTRAVRRSEWRFAFYGGAFLGFASLTDAIAFFMPALLLVWALVSCRTKRTAIPIIVVLITFGFVIAPWAYRNASVAREIGASESAPLISKGELEFVSPMRLAHMTSLLRKDGVLLSGLSKIFLLPYDISILDQGTHTLYKDALMHYEPGESLGLSEREVTILVAKISITLLHWVLLGLSVVGLVLMWLKGSRSYLLLLALLLMYTTVAVLGFGTLPEDDFQSISAPNSFLVPIIPLLIIGASFALSHLRFSAHRFFIRDADYGDRTTARSEYKKDDQPHTSISS